MFFRTMLVCVALMSSWSAVTAETLTLGFISDNIKKELKRGTPLAQYLETELAEFGVTEVAISVVPSSAIMTRELREGRVDMMFDSPLIAAKVAREAGGQPFVRRWKDGVGSYHSVIMVPVDGGIETLADLAGRRLGFQDPDSTSGFMLPAGLLRRENMTLRELSSRSDVPAADEIGYLFTGDDKNSLLWLYNGWIDAVATDPKSFAELDRAKPDTYRILARSIEVPRQVGIHRGGLEPELITHLIDVLIAMDSTPRGRKTLEIFNETSQFDRFPDGVDATFAPIYELLDQLAVEGVL